MEIDDPRQLIRLIRQIDLCTKYPVQGQMAGIHLSLFKGQGIEFSDIREYVAGDDIRSIDWKLTARHNRPYIKEFAEERDQTYYFVFDYSGSGTFGSDVSKMQKFLEITASLMFSVLRNNDRSGLLICTDKVEKFVPARGGRKHVISMLNTLITHKAESRESDIRPALVYLSKRLKRSCCVVILSDFYLPDFSRELKILKNHHEITGIQVTDRREGEFPDVGFIELEDAETGEQVLIDTSDPVFRARYQEAVAESDRKIHECFRKLAVPGIKITTDDPYHAVLNSFFSGKMSRGAF